MPSYAVQDPDAEKAALENAADQTLEDLAASMGLTLAQLTGQQPPPPPTEPEPETTIEHPHTGAEPSRSEGATPSPRGNLPESSSLRTGSRQGKRTRRMAAEEQAAAEAAKHSTEADPEAAGALKAEDECMDSKAAAGEPAAESPQSPASKTRAAKRARSSSVVRGSPPLLGGGDAEGYVQGQGSDKEKVAEGCSTRRAAKRGDQEAGLAASEKLEGRHGNDREGAQGGTAVPTGAEKSPEASEKENEQAEGKASEVRT